MNMGIRWGIVVALVVMCSTAESASEGEIDRAKARQDRQIKSFRMRKDQRGLETYAERERQKAERENTALQLWLAGRALHFAGKTRSAHTYLSRAYKADATLWHAPLRLAVMYLQQKKPDFRSSHYYIDKVLRLKPNLEQALTLQLQAFLIAKDHKRALVPLQTLHRSKPDDENYWRGFAECYLALRMYEEAIPWLERLRALPGGAADPGVVAPLAECYVQKKDWPKARGALVALKATPIWDAEPMAQKQLAVVLFQLQDFEGMEREMRAYLGRVPHDTAMLRLMLEYHLLRTKKLDEALAWAQKLRPLTKDPKKAAGLDDLIRRLKAGEDPTKPVERPQVDENNPLVQLIRRCIDPDPAVRRRALQEYLEYDLPFVDPIVYQRFSHEIEPDPDCRVFVLRILARFDAASMSEPEFAREVAKRLALSLEDPVAKVRTVGAETLGRLGVPAGLIYLLPHLTRVRVREVPADKDARVAIEREYNAVREAISTLSDHRDLSVADDPWVTIEQAQANRKHWEKWLDTEAAVPAKMRAVEDLAALEMEGMPAQRAAWFLRFGLDHCFRPSPWPVARRAYQMLRDVRQPEADGLHGKLWVGFPVLPDAALTEAKRDDMERALRAWWRKVAKFPTRGGRAGKPGAPKKAESAK